MNQPTRTSLASRLRSQADRAVDKLVQNNYGATKARYQQRFVRADRRFQGRQPVLIYTMGKVGSSSVYHSLKLRPLDRPLYHLHSLAPEPLDELEQELKPAFPDTLTSLRLVWRCQYVYQKLSDDPKGKLMAISLIRDPLARNLSAFFQHIRVEPLADTSGEKRWRVRSPFYDYETVAGKGDVGTLIDLYFEKMWHDFPTLWIKRELEGVLGINVYDTPFPKDKGYAIYHGDRADLLMVRLRDLDRCASQAVGEFLGLDDFALVNANVAEDKAYVEVYRAFKAQIRFPPAYLDRIYDTELVRYFYSEAERQALRAQWTQA